MAGVDKKLTDLTELSNPTDNAWIHIVEPTDISQNPAGSSYKVKKSNFGGLSDAPSDGETYGRKDGGWVTVSGEVLTTNTNITSSSLTTQDVYGFVTYINALNPVITVSANEIRTYTVTDTGQKFELLLRGRSFGVGEPAITISDVLDFEEYSFKQNTFFSRLARWKATGGTAATTFEISGAIIAGPTIYTGTKVNPTSIVHSGTMITEFERLVYRSGSSAGSSCGFNTGSGSVYSFGTGTGFDIEIRFDTSDLASVATSSMFVGIRSAITNVGNVDPETLINCFGVGNNENHANLRLIHNDNSGTATYTDLGSSFPANVVSSFYALRIISSGANKPFYWELRKYANTPISQVPEAYINGVVSANIQNAPGVPYAWHVHRCNRSTASAVEIAVGLVMLKRFY